ncbi:MAG: adenosine deaminase [Chlamydiales bacterium]|jgi:adenosine deaminase
MDPKQRPKKNDILQRNAFQEGCIETLETPKAELHVHLEGTVTPKQLKTLATKHNIALPNKIFGPNDAFAWDDFNHFLQVFDIVSSAIRTIEDYHLITYDYLSRSVMEGVIYTELTISYDHASQKGLSYQDFIAGVTSGMLAAKRDYQIESRAIVTIVRHNGPEDALKTAEVVLNNPHPLVTGFGLAGDEAGFPPSLFKEAFDLAAIGGLSCTAHAGEWAGPEGVWEAIEHLPLKRIGHGVRSIEDPELVKELVERGLVLECCPASNVALELYPSFEAHPFPKLLQAGVKVTLNSDDPPYFATTIGKEYNIAKSIYCLDKEALIEITNTAIRASFTDDETKEQLLNTVILKSCLQV